MTLSRLIIIALLAFVVSGTIPLTASLAGDEITAGRDASVNIDVANPMLLLLAASAPVFFFLGIIYWLDTRKEPLSLLLSCLFFGGLACVPAALIEGLLIPSNFTGHIAYSMASKATIVALTEEILKFLVLFWLIWKHKEFDQYYDGIVYAVYVSLGFALVENILYVLEFGREVAVSRAMLSIPGHCCDGVIMGYYFALAKFGPKGAVKWYLGASILLPVLVHGMYDYIVFYLEAMADSLESPLAVGLWGWFIFLMIYLWCTGSRRITAMTERDQNALLGTRSPEQERFFTIAMQQRNLLRGFCFGLLYIPFVLFLFAFLRDFLPDSSEDFHASAQLFFFSVPYVAYIFWMSQVVYRTTEALNMPRYVFGVFVAFFFTLPFLNLIVLLWLSGQATQTLKAAGYQVGLLGVDLEPFYH